MNIIIPTAIQYDSTTNEEEENDEVKENVISFNADCFIDYMQKKRTSLRSEKKPVVKSSGFEMTAGSATAKFHLALQTKRNIKKIHSDRISLAGRKFMNIFCRQPSGEFFK